MTSSGRTSPRAAGEGEERRFATVATGRVTLPESAQTLMRATEGAAAVVVVDEGRASLCATAATGLVTLQGSAPRVMAVTVAMLGDLFATDVTGLATLLGSALRATVDAMLAEVAMEEVAAIWDEVAAVDMEVPRVTLDVAATDTEVCVVLQVFLWSWLELQCWFSGFGIPWFICFRYHIPGILWCFGYCIGCVAVLVSFR